MNPTKPIEDIAAPKLADPSLLEPEIEHGIPVKHQEASPTSEQKNPIAAGKQFVENQSDNDAELEHILKDVNQNVKKEGNDANHKHRFAFFKKTTAKATEEKASTKTNNPKPIFAMAAAFIAGCVLSVAAVYAFKPAKQPAANNSAPAIKRVGTSAESSDSVQANGGTLVQPGDLTDLSNSLQSKINGLNDSQDFNQNDLSDQKLGL